MKNPTLHDVPANAQQLVRYVVTHRRDVQVERFYKQSGLDNLQLVPKMLIGVQCRREPEKGRTNVLIKQSAG